jgi:hypothetical protein
VLERVVGLDGLEQVEAVHVGHVDVRHDEVELRGTEHAARPAVFGFLAVVAAHLLEQAAHDAAHGGEVVDDKEFKVGWIAHGVLRAKFFGVIGQSGGRA